MTNAVVITVIAGLALLLAALALGWALRSAKQIQRLQQRIRYHENLLFSLRGALSALCSNEMLTDQRQTDTAQRLQHLAGQYEQLMLRDPEQGPYQHAMRLAVRGTTREELMENCGLTRGEADLLLFLHRSPEDSTDAS